MAYWRSVMAKMSVMAREECNGHRCNKRADKEYTWKATKAVHFRGFCVSLITHTPHAHHCSGTPHALLAGVVHGFRKPILQMSVRSTPCCFSVCCPFNQPSFNQQTNPHSTNPRPPPCKSARGGVGRRRASTYRRALRASHAIDFGARLASAPNRSESSPDKLPARLTDCG